MTTWTPHPRDNAIKLRRDTQRTSCYHASIGEHSYIVQKDTYGFWHIDVYLLTGVWVYGARVAQLGHARELLEASAVKGPADALYGYPPSWS